MHQVKRQQPENTSADSYEQVCARYRAAICAARKSGKPQIVCADRRWVRGSGRTAGDHDDEQAYEVEDCGFLIVDRVYLVTYNRSAVPRSPRYWRERERAAQLLHGMICTPADWRKIDDFYSRVPLDKKGKPLGRWGNVEPGQEWEAHAPDKCEGERWTFIEKRRSELRREFARAAGILPPLRMRLPWDGALLVTEIARPNRRGRPALKHAFYDLATAYCLSVQEGSGRTPRGFFPALARHLSMPEFGIRFSANELKWANHQIEAELQTAEGMMRNEYAARVQWGDHLMIAVLHTHLPPARAARITPEYRDLPSASRPSRIS